jgi:hypothetical protein
LDIFPLEIEEITIFGYNIRVINIPIFLKVLKIYFYFRSLLMKKKYYDGKEKVPSCIIDKKIPWGCKLFFEERIECTDFL